MTQLVDVGLLRAQGADLTNQVKALVQRFEREKDWTPEHTAHALLSIVYGIARRTMGAEEVLQRAVEQFHATEQALKQAKG